MARWRLNPVFVHECVAVARRWQTFAARTAFLAVLFLSLGCVWFTSVPEDPHGLTRNELANIGESFYLAFVGTQLALVLLAAPAYTAGAVCLDKARGTLAHLLVTDLSAAEIVLGKLGARLLLVLGLVLVGLPILALTMLLGGIDPEAVASSFIVTLGVAVVGCTLALALSVWGNQPAEALLATWFAWALALLPLPLWHFLQFDWKFGNPPEWLEKINPFWLCFAPLSEPDRFAVADSLVFLAGALGLATAFTLFAVLTLRSAALPSTSISSRGRWLPSRFGPSLDFNPVLWLAWHRRRPSRWMQIVWSVYLLLSLIASAVVLGMDRWSRGESAAIVNGSVFAIGLLLVSVTSVTALFEERVRGSLDVLLTTPLSTASIVWGKWLASFRTVMLVSLLPAGLAFCLPSGIWPGIPPVLLFVPLVLVFVFLVVGFPVALIRRVGVFVGPALTGYCLCVVGVFVFGAVVVLLDRGPRGDMLLLFSLLVPLMLAYGALVNSLGLALATRVHRFGMAIGLSVGVYVLLAVGPLFLLITTNSRGNSLELAYLSPWFGVGHATWQITERYRLQESIGGMILWLIIDGIAAVTVTIATQFAFDRCLGRIEGWWLVPVRPIAGRKIK